MFLSLSKLLPPFIYPLGLSCIFIIVSLLFRRRKRRAAAAAIFIALAILFVGGNQWAALWLARSLEWREIPSGPLPQADAIVILGGAVNEAAWPRPWVHLTGAGDRLLYAAKLYREGKAPLLILCGGSSHLNSQPEAASMAEVLEFIGVPDSAIVMEPESLNTHQNAVNTREIMAKRGIHRVLLVTSAMHMPRASMVFKHEGIDVLPAPTDFGVIEQEAEELRSTPAAILISLMPDAESLNLTTRALKEYVGLVVYRLVGWL
jgi:uncharacterized SAM-binding protein YcdF (DUF218 family)